MYIIGSGALATYVFSEYTRWYKDFEGFLDLSTMTTKKDGIITTVTLDNSSKFLLAINSATQRREVVNKLNSMLTLDESNFPNLIFENAYLDKTASLGIGCIVSRFSEIQANTSIGNFNIIMSHVSVGADCTIKNFNYINSGAKIQNRCALGNNNVIETNATITSLSNIDNHCIVDPGECLFENLHDSEHFKSGIAFKKNDNLLQSM